MSTTSEKRRSWRRKAAVVGLGALVLACGYLTFCWSDVNARLTASRFHSASTDEARSQQAARLAALGHAATPYIIAEWKGNDAARCQALAFAVSEHLTQLPPNDPRFVQLCRPIVAAAPQLSPVGQEAILELVPLFLSYSGDEFAAACREIVRQGLAAPTAEGRVRAVRLAMRPDLDIRAEIVGALGDADAEVRRAAMLAIGPNDGHTPTVIGEDELFRWLHDADWDVRQLCEAALGTRGLEPEQITCARLLTHPEPAERLRLLVLLLNSRDTIRDPGPWLERLSRDPEPAVRAGAARVACECQLAFTTWLDRLATTDPNSTVRQIASYHRTRSANLREAGFERR